MNIELEKRAIQYLKTFEPENEPYYLCYSGGKDSDAIRILAEIAGVKHDIVNNHTTVDAPETVRYIRSIPNVQIQMPEKTMWQLIVEKKHPPTRLSRYCCERLKEHGGQGRMKSTGVRKAESRSRYINGGLIKIIGNKTTEKNAELYGAEYQKTPKGGLILNIDNHENRRFVEHCYRTTQTMLNPIVDWSNDDVWDFLKYYGCSSNPLYQCGFKRIGCIGCPMGGFKNMKKEFALYPKYRANYVRTFDKMIKAREKAGLQNSGGWKDGESVMRWWVGESPLQVTLEDYFKYYDELE